MSAQDVENAKAEAKKEFRTRKKKASYIKLWYVQDSIAIRRGFRSWGEYLKALRARPA